MERWTMSLREKCNDPSTQFRVHKLLTISWKYHWEPTEYLKGKFIIESYPLLHCSNIVLLNLFTISLDILYYVFLNASSMPGINF